MRSDVCRLQPRVGKRRAARELGLEARRAQMASVQQPDPRLHGGLAAIRTRQRGVDTCRTGHSHRDLYDVIEVFDGGDEQLHGTGHVQLAEVFALLRRCATGSHFREQLFPFGVVLASAVGFGDYPNGPPVRAPAESVGVLAVVTMNQVSLARPA